ncbi:hypothetical protein [Yersinia alsatica]|uniref:hypothetical protein n=1 Tax=Yersinia alsatica TaxID=2890317 RepID=UPI001C528985|nr:hypothetical protein [Yersinia alsatica]
MVLQQGSQRTNPDELTQVSDSGARVQLTPLSPSQKKEISQSHWCYSKAASEQIPMS